MRSITFILVFIALIAGSCRKKKDELVRIEGFLLRDHFGNTMGWAGNPDEDWKAGSFSGLPDVIREILNRNDTVDLQNTFVSGVEEVICYPNPVYQSSTLYFRAADSVKLKVILVDATGKVYREFAKKIKDLTVRFDISDPALFPSGKAFRYYFSYSAAGNPNFKAGYGDIKVCQGTTYTECF